MDTALNIAVCLVEAADLLRGDIDISDDGDVSIVVEADELEHCQVFAADDPIVRRVGELVGRNRWLEAELDKVAARARRLEGRLRGVRAVVDGAGIATAGDVRPDTVFAPLN